ncbi:hypothetical protein [Parabacteroides sp. PF5-6]|uniref:hypothetical protein n=1 Tax=Parabacteroides sp. PF5-6 TaxID=1742403 RepID=UPI002407537C|nr:hypothetical protein [Parabacteroides sp. PF5-6]MDF9829101.1 hypothetical protein [Parabacteroides sp. PF5-6]
MTIKMEQEKPVKKHRRWKKFRNTTAAILLLGLLGFAGIRYYYPYGEGVKTGQLNYVVYKGVIFKTYEGKLIQSGFWSNTPGGIQSNEFEFSIADPVVADKLMHAGGQVVELHYKEYFGSIPWRGYSRYIVDEIVQITNQE